MTVAMLSDFTFGIHVSATSQSGMAAGMNHGAMSSKSVSCASVCTTTTINRGDDLEIIENERDDDDKAVPFYALIDKHHTSISKQHSVTARELIKYEPPPGLPLYIKFASLRM